MVNAALPVSALLVPPIRVETGRQKKKNQVNAGFRKDMRASAKQCYSSLC